MKWRRRLCWLIAWSVWLWLSIGLFRQLPREMGKVVFETPLALGEWCIGFVDHTPKVATFKRRIALKDDGGYCCWDVRTKTAVTRKADRLSPWGFRSALSPRTAFLVVAGVSPDDQPSPDVSTALDLLTGRGCELPVGISPSSFHPTNPWAMFSSSFGPGKGADRIQAFDLRTAEKVFEWNEAVDAKAAAKLQAAPIFVGEDRVAIPTDASGASALEIWTIPQRDEPIARFPNLKVGSDAVASSSGRIAWHDLESEGFAVCVFDVAAGRIVFRQPPEKEGSIERLARGVRSPALSGDGRRVLAPIAGKLFDVDSGKVLWSASDEESIRTFDENLFETHELRDIDFGFWRRRLDTFTVRGLHDGSLLYRTWVPTLSRQAVDAEGRRYVLVDKIVFESPPVVNLPLVAGCQIALALPLVVVWLVEWWKQRRGGTTNN